jgi:hypothetical protein
MFQRWKLLLPAICLAACAPAKDPDQSPPQKTVLDPLTQQMDRAKQVQVTVDEHTADTRKQIESAENGDASR